MKLPQFLSRFRKKKPKTATGEAALSSRAIRMSPKDTAAVAVAQYRARRRRPADEEE